MPDAIVVLGIFVEKNGQIDIPGRDRMNRAINLYKRGVAPKIIVSGYASGFLDFISHKQPITEAEAMKRYAIKRRIPKSAIIKEEQAKDTIGNAVFTKKILKKNKWKNIVVVTNKIHNNRARNVFKKILGKEYKVVMSPVTTYTTPWRTLKGIFIEREMTFFTNNSPIMKTPMNDAQMDQYLKKHHPFYRGL